MLFIVNETAGAGKSGEQFKLAEKYLCENNVDYSVEYTKSHGHGKELARAAVMRGEKHIIAVGGDGTVREVASSLVNTDVKFGILPFGTGNDIVKALNIPTQIEAAVDNALYGSVKKMDCCMLNGQYFFNVAGLGFDVDTLVETERFKTRFRGIIPYLLGIMSALAHKKKIPVKITLDDGIIEGDVLIVAVANGKYFGGGMKVAPDACPFDGSFDIIIVRYVNTLRFLTLLGAFIKGTHIKNTNVVTVKRSKNVNIEVVDKNEFPVQMDGDIDEVTPARFTLFEGALNITVPEEAE